MTSGIAVPAQAGIPVTHRGTSGSVHVVTGHGAAGEDGLPEDMETLAALKGTLVFLMGLIEQGKWPKTPAAVIQGGFEGETQIVRGCLENIAEKVRISGISAPAVIVIGPVAEMDLWGENANIC